LAILAPAVLAENIDPGDVGAQYVWGENVGWLNAQPTSPGGPGVQVDDYELSGWMWGENIGWVSLSCENTSSCDTTEYRVRNDGGGVLNGFAWGENVGWINFGPTTGGGVSIDRVTGIFSGFAWSENVGWISFRSTGANSFTLVTAWRCDPVPAPPADPPLLMLDKSGSDAELNWSAVAGATVQDVVYGSLDDLRTSGGDFATSTRDCLADKDMATMALAEGALLDPESLWYLVRALNCGGAGSYDSGGAGQAASRDAGIATSGSACP
jgi:hypothetical protein